MIHMNQMNHEVIRNRSNLSPCALRCFSKFIQVKLENCSFLSFCLPQHSVCSKVFKICADKFKKEVGDEANKIG